MFKRILVSFILALLVGIFPLFLFGEDASGATTLPRGFKEARLVTGLRAPSAMAFAPDGRLFVAEQGGKLRIVKSGRLLASPFVDLGSITDPTGERGLLGVALDPNFAQNRFVYVYYTLKGTSTRPAHNRVSRFIAGGDVAVRGSEKVLLDLDNLDAAKKNHNGGALGVGRDGKLYVAVGENATPRNAQTLDNLLGKMLRINLDGSIPADNPFYGEASGRNRAIWALGLRNPYSFAVHPGTGRVFVNDVGQDAWEEINDGVAGANYGWPLCEGPTCAQPAPARYRGPLYWYGHGNTASTGCAITGGAFYNPANVRFPGEYVGDYLFADICNGWINRLDYDPARRGFVRTTGFATGLSAPVDLKVHDGRLFYLSRGTGSVQMIRYAP